MTGPLDEVAEAIRSSLPEPIGCLGAGTRGGLPADTVAVRAPGGILRIEPEEMIVRCLAGTPVEELSEALAAHGQEISLPAGGTIGGALAVGRSDPLRLGRGPVRDTVLEIHYVDAVGTVVRNGGPTVKNVSGFDLCRLLVGSWGTLGLLGEVVLRTRPIPRARRWYSSESDPDELLRSLHRPVSILWDGAYCTVCLEGHPGDLDAAASRFALTEVDGPPRLPDRFRWSIPPGSVTELRGTGTFVAEIGVGVVHHGELPPPERAMSTAQRTLMSRVRAAFDPERRFLCGADAPEEMRSPSEESPDETLLPT
jgi:FAD/FMN-containing dehydrogenase